MGIPVRDLERVSIGQADVDLDDLGGHDGVAVAVR
jgi:hypothetical protein